MTTELRYHPDNLNFTYRFPIITKQVGFGPQTDLQIKRTILERGDEQGRKTNVKALMTGWFMQKEDSLFKEIGQQAIALAQEHSPHKIKFETYDCWGSISYRGDWTKTHDHWPHPWSWVYYSAVSDDCSPLHFPHTGFNSVEWADTGDNSKGYWIKPEQGELIMWPGWLYHGTKPQKTDFERVIVAGNIYVNI